MQLFHSVLMAYVDLKWEWETQSNNNNIQYNYKRCTFDLGFIYVVFQAKLYNYYLRHSLSVHTRF